MEYSLTATFAAEITAKHQECVSLDGKIRELFLRKVNVTREIGELLKTAKEQMGIGAFTSIKRELPMAREVEPGKYDYSAITAYETFFAQNPEPFDDFNAAMKAAKSALSITGLLAGPGKATDNVMHPKVSFFGDFLTSIQNLAHKFSKYCNLRPVTEWSQEEAEQFIRSCRPVFDIAKKVEGVLR